MRFYCGPTWAERCILRAKLKHEKLTQWHPFFCLLPRRVGKECVWLETIRRKGRYIDNGYHGGHWYFEYRLSIEKEILV